MSPTAKLSGIPKPVRVTFITLVILAAFWSLLGFLIVPWIAKDQGEKILSEMLDRNVTIEKVALNPWSLEVWVDGFTIPGSKDASAKPLLAFDQLYANLQVRSIWRLTASFEKIQLTKPLIQVAMIKKDVFNFTDILKHISESSEAEPKKETSEDDQIFPVQADLIDVDDAKLVYQDLTQARKPQVVLTPISFDLRGFTTIKDESGNQYHLNIVGERGGKLSLAGDFSLSPFAIIADVNMTNLDLVPFFAFYESLLNFKLESAKLSIAGHVDVKSEAETHVDLTKGTVSLTKVVVSETEPEKHEGLKQEPLIKFDDLTVSGVNVSTAKRTAMVEAVTLNQFITQVIVLPDQSINMVKAMDFSALTNSEKTTTAQPQVAAKPAEESEPWQWKVDTVKLLESEVLYHDLSLPTPADIDVDNIHVELKDISQNLEARLPLSIAAMLNDQGKIDVTGQVRLQPVGVDLHFKTDDIPLAPANPYVEKLTRSQLDKGTLDSDLSIKVALNDRYKPTVLDVAGNLEVSSFAMSTIEPKAPMVAFDSLQVDVAKADVFSNEYHVSQATLQKPEFYFQLFKNGTNNLSVVTQKSAKLKKPIEQGLQKMEITSERFEGKPLQLLVDKVSIVEGNVDFTDETVSPVFHMQVMPMTMQVTNFTTEDENATFKLSSRLNHQATLSAEGRMNVMQKEPSFKFQVKERGLDMQPLSPYSAKYVNYPIERGVMSFDLDYGLKDQHLDGKNDFRMANLEMGPKQNNPDALDLPIPLALTFLRNNRGVVNLNMDVTGDINDPDFNLGKVIIGVFTNIIFKAISSPFTLLGVLTEGDTTSQSILFMDGSAALDQVSRTQLDALADSMTKEPTLVIELVGTVDYKADQAALAENQQPSDKVALEQLAADRVQTVANYLTTTGQIDTMRIRFGSSEVKRSDRDAGVLINIEKK